MFLKIISFLLVSLNFYAQAAIPKSVKGENLVTAESMMVSTALTDKRGLVIVFLSAKCPCSNSHVALLKKLSQTYKDFKFLGVHSNSDETKAEAAKYFKTAALPFEVLQDEHTRIADAFQAYKTPHAFVLNPAGQVVYQGGVTNSTNAPSADVVFLENALKEISAGQPVSVAEGRTLGCVILRENEKHGG